MDIKFIWKVKMIDFDDDCIKETEEFNVKDFIYKSNEE